MQTAKQDPSKHTHCRLRTGVTNPSIQTIPTRNQASNPHGFNPKLIIIPIPENHQTLGIKL